MWLWLLFNVTVRRFYETGGNLNEKNQIDIGGDEMSDLLQEIKDYLDSIRHNAVNAALAKNVNEYGVCVKIVSDCEEAVLSLFRKLDREYWKLREQFEQAQVKIERCKEIFKDIREASSDIYALRKAEQALQALEGKE